MNTIHDLRNNYHEVFEFKEYDDDSNVYKRDKNGLAVLNQIFDADFKLLFRNKNSISTKNSKNGFDWDSETIFVVTKNGKIVKMNNSEWSHFQTI